MKLALIFIFLLISKAHGVTTQELGSWYFDIDWQFQNTSVEHYESSGTSGFESAAYKSTYKRHDIHFKLQKEVMSHWPFSISLFPVVGLSLVSDSQTTKEELSYAESLSGLFAGGGVALNINIFTKSLKIQPFISASSLKHKDEYFFRWDNAEDTERSREIKTVLEYSSLVYTVGVRFYNFKDMICTLAVSAHEYTIDSFDADASMGETEYNLTKNASIQRGRSSATVGFGFIF